MGKNIPTFYSKKNKRARKSRNDIFIKENTYLLFCNKKRKDWRVINQYSLLYIKSLLFKKKKILLPQTKLFCHDYALQINNETEPTMRKTKELLAKYCV